ncbi:MAG: hypothetical protein CXT77_03415 [uncultured DHVE6 group euryarchaeote]|jgi:hypothetical protein|nr:MAG: hypothetical protein CXT77_03415 [uncultured DHVE6 group euryarchaeote]
MKIQNIFFIFLLLIFVSGCTGGSRGGSDFGTGITQSNAGVDFDISKLPPKISSGSQFDLEVTVVNKGSYSLQPGDVLLTMSNTKQFEFKLESNSLQTVHENNGFTNARMLMKALDKDVEGDSNAFYFSNLNYSSSTVRGEDITVPISINSCYYYNTIATLDICVAKDITSDICSSNEIKKVVNQAAPVHVSGFKQESSLLSGTDINSNIIIFISSYGNEKFESYVTPDSTGQITDNTLLSDRLDCTNTDKTKYSAVRLKSIRIGSDILIGGKGIDTYCEVSATPNIIQLDENGAASVSCALPLTENYMDGRGDYSERMIITLDYLVSDSVTKGLVVVGN